jgi:DNA-binding transcriptional LysR family regulator
MDIQDIEIFARVAALGNLSAVGSELGLTPGTISKRVQALEDEMGVRLFERTTRSIRITDEGLRFRVHVERILAEMEQARAMVADSAGRPTGKLRVAASQALSRDFVAPAVSRFLATYPDIEVQINLADGPVNLQEEGYDVAIFSGVPADSALIAKRLFVDRHIVVAAPSYLKAAGCPMRPEDLLAHACLALADTWAWSFLVDGRDVSVRIGARLRSDSLDLLRLAAIDGGGLMRASELHVAHDLKAGRLVRVLDEFAGGGNDGVFALYAGGKHVLPRLRVFLDFLGDWFRTQGDVATSNAA